MGSKKKKIIVFLCLLLLVAALIVNLAPRAGQRGAENFLLRQLADVARLVTGEPEPPTAAELKQAELAAAKLETARQAELAKEKFSRLTFFLREPLVGSLAIPAGWEGRYRAVEAAGMIDFFYAPLKGRELPLFSIRLFKSSAEKTAAEEWQVLKREGDFTFGRKIYNSDDPTANETSDYEQMKTDLPKIFDSFKFYKNS